MSARGAGHELRRFAAEYQRTWNATGPAGRGFLLGGLCYLVRAIAFTVAFPLYAKERGYSPGEIGLFLAASQFSLCLLGVPITFLGGRGFARRVLTITPAIAAAGIAIILAAPEGLTLLTIVGALLAGAGGASFWVLGDPLLAHTTPAGERAHIFALKFFVLTFAAALGGGIGGWIPGLLEGAANMSALSALAATLAIFFILDLVQVGLFARIPDYEVRLPRIAKAARAQVAKGSRAWLPWAVMIAFAVPEIGMALGHNSIRPFLSLFFTEEHNFSASSTGTALAIFGLLGGAGALATPRVAARMGNIPSIAVLRVIGAGTILLWFTGIGLAPLLALMVVYYVAMDGTEAIFITESMNRMPASRRTWFSGIYAMAWSISAASASIISGAIQDRNDGAFGAAFAVGAFGYLFSVAWILFVFPRLPNLHAHESAANVFDVSETPEETLARAG
jgi:predicted MFS family arabinose efflux permease